MKQNDKRAQLRTAALKIADIIADLFEQRSDVRIDDVVEQFDEVTKKRAEKALKKRGLR